MIPKPLEGGFSDLKRKIAKLFHALKQEHIMNIIVTFVLITTVIFKCHQQVSKDRIPLTYHEFEVVLLSESKQQFSQHFVSVIFSSTLTIVICFKGGDLGAPSHSWPTPKRGNKGFNYFMLLSVSHHFQPSKRLRSELLVFISQSTFDSSESSSALTNTNTNNNDNYFFF